MLEQLRLPYGGDRSKQREAVKKVTSPFVCLLPTPCRILHSPNHRAHGPCFPPSLPPSLSPALPPSLPQVLEFLQVDLYDVPFLWAYRRDYFAPHLPDRSHPWSITR